MNQLSNVQKALLETTAGSTADANRLYSILIDTKESATAENMYDIAEILMRNEKNNSKIALEQLWTLKKNMSDEQVVKTVDMLISHFQEKLNILRGKEENIKKISKESRELLDDKRKKDAEIASVKQQIGECNEEIERLTKKMSELASKEQELNLIEIQLRKELQVNANEVVNGLYEIIFSNFGKTFSVSAESSLPQLLKEAQNQANQLENVASEIQKQEKVTLDKEKNKVKEPKVEGSQTKPTRIYDEGSQEDFSRPKQENTIPFPKSVVKTTSGGIIGEYYYDPKIHKNNRHYIYNSNFFRKRMLSLISELLKKFNSVNHAEAQQIIQDAYKRVIEKSNLHYEISTNEIINKNVLKELWQKIMNREYQDILSVCNKLHAKIEALGNNYAEMLSEQMNRLHNS